MPIHRGPEYSRPFKQILDEAKYLAETGAKEIILLGQNVNAIHMIEKDIDYQTYY